MSVENLKKYAKLCAENEEAGKKAKEIDGKDLEGRIAHAKSLGLEISKADFEALAKEIGLDGKKELSDEDLEKVAGGATDWKALIEAMLEVVKAAKYR
jgi:predicted ribosomally synthesized peptide with nif11-like leader